MQNDLAKALRSEPRSHETDSLVQAVFGEREFVADTAPNVEVVVKRKRTFQADDGTTIDGRPPDGTAVVRTPRVFKIEGALQPALNQAEQVDAASPLRESIPRKRRRRVPHGEVTIIRPVATDLSETERLRDFPGPPKGHSAVSHFGVGPAEQQRYVTLMAEIANLKLQAQAAKRTEAVAAVCWIRKAIADFELSAAELGFG